MLSAAVVDRDNHSKSADIRIVLPGVSMKRLSYQNLGKLPIPT